MIFEKEIIDLTKEKSLNLAELGEINKEQRIMQWINQLPSPAHQPVLNDSDDIPTLQEYEPGSLSVSIQFFLQYHYSFNFH